MFGIANLWPTFVQDLSLRSSKLVGHYQLRALGSDMFEYGCITLTVKWIKCKLNSIGLLVKFTDYDRIELL